MEHRMLGTPLDRSEMSLTISICSDVLGYRDKSSTRSFGSIRNSSWLIPVFFVKITAYSHVAYTMFEAMNDRGLQLTHSELLRGYLLSRIERDEDRQTASDRCSQTSSRCTPGELAIRATGRLCFVDDEYTLSGRFDGSDHELVLEIRSRLLSVR